MSPRQGIGGAGLDFSHDRSWPGWRIDPMASRRTRRPPARSSPLARFHLKNRSASGATPASGCPPRRLRATDPSGPSRVRYDSQVCSQFEKTGIGGEDDHRDSSGSSGRLPIGVWSSRPWFGRDAGLSGLPLALPRCR